MKVFHFAGRLAILGNVDYKDYIISAETLEDAWFQFNRNASNMEKSFTWNVTELDIESEIFYEII